MTGTDWALIALAVGLAWWEWGWFINPRARRYWQSVVARAEGTHAIPPREEQP